MNLAPTIAGLRAYAERTMTDRAAVERDQGRGTGRFDGDKTDWQPHLTSQKCKAWVESGDTNVSADRTAVTSGWRMAVPVGTDVRPGDKVTSLKDSRDATLTDSTLFVDHVSHKRDQLVCSLERRG